MGQSENRGYGRGENGSWLGVWLRPLPGKESNVPNEDKESVVELRLAVLADSDDARKQCDLFRKRVEASPWFSQHPWLITVVMNSPLLDEDYPDLFSQRTMENRQPG